MLYPVLTYLGLQVLDPVWLLSFLLGLLVLRALLIWWRGGAARLWAATTLLAALVIAAGAYWLGDRVSLRFYPAVMSCLVASVFFASLLIGRPLIEQLARLQNPDLPPQGVRYTRNLTGVWVIILLVNSAIAAWTALYASFASWALYNGLLSYLFLGSVFAIEYLIRGRVKQRWSAI
ncbi:MAG TPA: hypothetical protein VFP95_03015 [Gammaproteobacteria bacterium]|nr:hypothetical protein [Gammaproteobacteria bacterium]